MKTIPLLQHEGIKANYKSLNKLQEDQIPGEDQDVNPVETGKTHSFLMEKINNSLMSTEDQAALTELVRSTAPVLQPEEDEAFRRHVEYLIRLKETRVMK